MANRQIIRGDSYGLRRPFYIIPLTDLLDNGDGTFTPIPFNLAGSKVSTTFKVRATDPGADPNDTGAPIAADIEIDADGVVTLSSGLVIPDGRTAADGILHHRLTKAQTRALPVNQKWISDVQVTDANGEDFTKTFEETVEAVNSITNRGAV